MALSFILVSMVLLRPRQMCVLVIYTIIIIIIWSYGFMQYLNQGSLRCHSTYHSMSFHAVAMQDFHAVAIQEMANYDLLASGLYTSSIKFTDEFSTQPCTAPVSTLLQFDSHFGSFLTLFDLVLVYCFFHFFLSLVLK